jgi:hypothetical protein
MAFDPKAPGTDCLGQITRQTRSTVAGTPCRSWHSPEDVLILSASQLLLSLARHRLELGMQVRQKSMDTSVKLQPGFPILGHLASRPQYLLIDSNDSMYCDRNERTKMVPADP